MPTSPGAPGAPDGPPGNHGAPPAGGPPPSFFALPPGGALFALFERFRPVIEIVAQNLPDLGAVFGPESPEQIRERAERGRQKFTLRALRETRLSFEKAAFLELAGAKDTARAMVENIGELVGLSDRGRLDDDRAEEVRAQERLAFLDSAAPPGDEGTKVVKPGETEPA
jgi:hypothetical protein